MNIFGTLRTYAGKWSLKSSRKFEEEEINAVSKAEVVPSSYGNSVCFFMKSGGNKDIALSNDATVGVGDSVDLSKAQLLTLEKEAESDILRLKIQR